MAHLTTATAIAYRLATSSPPASPPTPSPFHTLLIPLPPTCALARSSPPSLGSSRRRPSQAANPLPVPWETDRHARGILDALKSPSDLEKAQAIFAQYLDDVGLANGYGMFSIAQSHCSGVVAEECKGVLLVEVLFCYKEENGVDEEGQKIYPKSEPEPEDQNKDAKYGAKNGAA
ncbi:Uu.00g081060.m01.CDS01 [Anthostomella pinea]|uniref:Uu.00g081060.m01.CDS01 n=1 Tax=Anthostomella pinea TaxID=933095 RepID=A0AAI8VL40_9PEZI|nr:Uu.00g081060.m01.CDS01 [Anthostomella pinea]